MADGTATIVAATKTARDLRGRTRAVMTAIVDDLLGEVPVGDTDVELTALTLIGGGLELITTWLRGDLDVDRDHLIDFIVALMLTSTELSAALARH